jgi:DNA-binding transcriptional ArsR family regulator
MGALTEKSRPSRVKESGISTTEGAAVFKALGDGNRLRIMLALQGRELCVCQIVALLELANSTVSQHLSLLRGAGLIERHKRGRWIYYRLATDSPNQKYREYLSQMLSALSKNSQSQRDQRRLKEILKLDPEELCRTLLPL